MRTEKQVRDSCLSYAKKIGLLHKRMHFGHGAAGGWPDDLFVFGDGTHLWVEFKAEGKTATPLQAETHETMSEHCCLVSVIDDKDQFVRLIDAVSFCP